MDFGLLVVVWIKCECYSVVRCIPSEDMNMLHLRLKASAVFFSFSSSYRLLSKTQVMMQLLSTIIAFSAFLPAVLACKGYTGGVPKAVGTKTNSKVIEIKAGQVFDGAWYRYDRGSGACKGQTEGGTYLSTSS